MTTSHGLIQASALNALSFLVRYPGQKIPLRSWVLDGSDLSLVRDRAKIDDMILSCIMKVASSLDLLVQTQKVAHGDEERILLWI